MSSFELESWRECLQRKSNDPNAKYAEKADLAERNCHWEGYHEVKMWEGVQGSSRNSHCVSTALDPVHLAQVFVVCL